MFRDNKSTTPMDTALFGVGSIIDDERKSYLVISNLENHVQLVDLDTMKTFGDTVRVDDINHLTKNDVLKLIHFSSNSFSDFHFNSRGIKFEFSGFFKK